MRCFQSPMAVDISNSEEVYKCNSFLNCPHHYLEPNCIFVRQVLTRIPVAQLSDEETVR
jgi:hypothetical protein